MFDKFSGSLPVAADQLDIYWREKDADSEWVGLKRFPVTILFFFPFLLRFTLPVFGLTYKFQIAVILYVL